MKMRTQQPKIWGHRESSPKIEIHIITGLPQEARKISINLTLHLSEPEEQQQTKLRMSRRN